MTISLGFKNYFTNFAEMHCSSKVKPYDRAAAWIVTTELSIVTGGLFLVVMAIFTSCFSQKKLKEEKPLRGNWMPIPVVRVAEDYKVLFGEEFYTIPSETKLCTVKDLLDAVHEQLPHLDRESMLLTGNTNLVASDSEETLISGKSFTLKLKTEEKNPVRRRHRNKTTTLSS